MTTTHEAAASCFQGTGMIRWNFRQSSRLEVNAGVSPCRNSANFVPKDIYRGHGETISLVGACS